MRRALRRLMTSGRRGVASAHRRPAARGVFDEPSERWLPRRPVLFRGWALDGADAPVTVTLIINGATRVPAAVGDPRPDVASNLEAGVTGNSGWSTTVDLSAWPEGDLGVRVVVETRSGRREMLAHRAFLVRGHDVEGAIDGPPDGGTVDGLLVLRGWAVAGAHLPARVDVEVNGRPVGRARLRLPRADVEALDPARHGPLAGFEFRDTLVENPGTAIDVGVVVVARDGGEMRLPSHQVTVLGSTADATDTERAATLRQRTQTDAHAVLRVPRVPRRVAGGRDLLVFTHSLRLGGGELYLQELLRQLVPAMHRCVLVAPSDGALRMELEAMGVEVVISGRELPRDVEAYEGWVRDLTMMILGTGCDLLIGNTIGVWPAVDAASRLGIPTLWAIHESLDLFDWIDLNFGPGGCHPYVRARIEGSMRAASYLVFEADATRDIFAAYADNSRRLTVPYGVDVDAIEKYVAGVDRRQLRRDRDILEGATVLLTMGVLEERKAQACLVEAFAEVSTVHRDAVLVLVGDHPSPYSDALHRVIAGLDIADRIRLVPITGDIYPWYAIADVLVSGSDVESLPRSMLEAMAFGVPVLAADVFGVPELIDDGGNGWLYRSRDMVAMIAALHRVLGLGAEERQRVGERARSAVRERHRSALYGDRYRELIEAAAPLRY